MAKAISKMNKKGLATYLKENADKVTKNLKEMIEYNLKKYKEVNKSDLYELAQEVKASLEGSQVALENSLKVKADTPDTKTEETKKSSKKTLKPSKKAEEPEVKVEIEEKESPKQKDIAKNFPKKFTTNGVDFTVRLDINNIKELEEVSNKLIAEGKALVFAFYWSKRLLKQFTYDTNGFSKSQPKSFEHDLDLANLIYFSDKVAYALSDTDLMYLIKPEELEVIDGMRFANGIEYNIYEYDTKQLESK